MLIVRAGCSGRRPRQDSPCGDHRRCGGRLGLVVILRRRCARAPARFSFCLRASRAVLAPPVKMISHASSPPPPPVFPLYRAGQAGRLLRCAAPLRVTWRAATIVPADPPFSGRARSGGDGGGAADHAGRCFVCFGDGWFGDTGWRRRFGTATGGLGRITTVTASGTAPGTAGRFGCLYSWFWRRRTSCWPLRSMASRLCWTCDGIFEDGPGLHPAFFFWG